MSRNNSSQPRSICVLRLSAVGDVCHTLPVVRTLQAHWPDTPITWIIGKLEAGLIDDIPDIEFITFNKSAGLAGYHELRQRLTDRHFDVLLHMQMSLRASIASLTAIRADVKLGFDRQRAHDWQWLFTNRQIAYQPRQHVMQSLFGFAEALGVNDQVLRWDIPVRDTDAAYAQTQIDHERPVLLISPCANARFRNFRNWRTERYAAVADFAATQLGMQVLLTGGPSEVELDYGKRITAAMRTQPGNLIGTTSLRQLFALIQRSTVLLSPDSGPIHMATAAGIPVIGLYATTNPDRAGPWFSQRWCINRYPDAMRRFNRQSPETARWGTRVRTPEAMDMISVEDVTGKLEQLMSARQRGEVLLQSA